MKRKSLFAAVLATVLTTILIAPACDPEPLRVAADTACSASSDCPAYAACNRGFCHIRCDERTSCPFSRTIIPFSEEPGEECGGDGSTNQTPCAVGEPLICDTGVCLDKCSLFNDVDVGSGDERPRTVNGVFALDATHLYWVESPEVTAAESGSSGSGLDAGTTLTLSIWRRALRPGATKERVVQVPVPAGADGPTWRPVRLHSTGANLFFLSATSPATSEEAPTEGGVPRRFHLVRVALADSTLTDLGVLATFRDESGTSTSSLSFDVFAPAYFFGKDLLYVPAGETRWRRRKLDTWELDAQFDEPILANVAVSAQRLTWMSRRDPATDVWELRYLDLPDGAPTWSQILAPPELTGLTDVALSLQVGNGSVGAEGTRVFYGASSRANPADLVLTYLDTSKPGSGPTELATFQRLQGSSFPRFVGGDALVYVSAPESEKEVPGVDEDERKRICSVTLAFSLATGARRILGSGLATFLTERTGEVLANEEVIARVDSLGSSSSSNAPRLLSIGVAQRFPNFVDPVR